MMRFSRRLTAKKEKGQEASPTNSTAKEDKSRDDDEEQCEEVDAVDAAAAADRDSNLKNRCSGQNLSLPQNVERLSTPETPQQHHGKTNKYADCKATSPFVPPEEINIDFDAIAVPLSPIRDPAVTQAGRLEPNLSPVVHHDVYAEDISTMKRQLLNSQRLVRLILGKPLSYAPNRHEIDASLLDTNTILQAIQAFALMKQELGDLRKRQEHDDNDPPAILQTIGSPSMSTPSSKSIPQAESTPRCFPDIMTPRLSQNFTPTSQPPNSVVALWDANKQIEKLQEELGKARTTIHSLEQRQQQQQQHQQQQRCSQEESTSIDRDDEINRLQTLLRQSQSETDDLKRKLERLSLTSMSETTSSTKEDEDIENKDPAKNLDNSNTKYETSKPLPLYEHEPICEEEKKADT